MSHQVSEVIYICLKRITAPFGSVFWCRLVSATQGLIRYIPRGILARQTEVDEIINGRTLGPGVSLRSTLKVPITIDFDRMEAIRIHLRRAKHYIVGRAIATRVIQTRGVLILKCDSLPMGDISLMHKSNAL
jgi:hypothetical protein